MTTNPMADAIKPGPEPPTKQVPWPHFYSDLHRQQREQQRDREAMSRMSRQELFDNGYIGVKDLDDEELRYGRCRDRNGRIPRVNNSNALVPRDLYDEMVAEHLKRTQEKFRQHLDSAISTVVDIMEDESVEPKDRLAASTTLMDRYLGKSVDRVAVHSQKEPWEEVAMDVGRITRAEHERKKRAALDVEFTEIPDGRAESTEGAAESVAPQDQSPVPRVHGLGNEPHIAEEDIAAEVVDTSTPRAEPTRRQTDMEPGGVGPVEPDHRAEVEQVGWAHPTFVPHEPAPSYVNPAHSSSTGTLSEDIRSAQERAIAVAERRAERRSLVEAAKKRRKFVRSMGGDILRKELGDTKISDVQDRLVAVIDNTDDVSGEDGADSGTLGVSGSPD